MIIAIFTAISLFFGVMAYLLLNNVIIAVPVFLAFEFLLVVVIRPMVASYKTKTRRRHECYQFVYSFVVSLSSLNAGEGAYSSALEGATGEEKALTDSISQYPLKERIEYLANYFKEDYYRMFLSIYHIYEEQGGDVLEIAGPLLIEVAEVEKVENQKEKVKMNNLVQFITLWTLSALILLSIRFGLAMFYSELSGSLLYVALTFCYFALVIISIALFMANLTGEKIKVEIRRTKKHARKRKTKQKTNNLSSNR